jgi:hypothetical protein
MRDRTAQLAVTTVARGRSVACRMGAPSANVVVVPVVPQPEPAVDPPGLSEGSTEPEHEPEPDPGPGPEAELGPWPTHAAAAVTAAAAEAAAAAAAAAGAGAVHQTQGSRRRPTAPRTPHNPNTIGSFISGGAVVLRAHPAAQPYSVLRRPRHDGAPGSTTRGRRSRRADAPIAVPANAHGPRARVPKVNVEWGQEPPNRCGMHGLCAAPATYPPPDSCACAAACTLCGRVRLERHLTRAPKI